MLDLTICGIQLNMSLIHVEDVFYQNQIIPSKISSIRITLRYRQVKLDISLIHTLKIEIKDNVIWKTSLIRLGQKKYLAFKAKPSGL